MGGKKTFSKISSSRNVNWRINLFLALVFLTAGLILYQLFNLTFVRHSFFAESASDQYASSISILSKRGNIYFNDMADGQKKIVAANKTSFYVYGNEKLKNAGDMAAELASVSGGEEAKIDKTISDGLGKSYFVVVNGLTLKQARVVQELKIEGLGVAKEINRIYDNGDQAAPMVGFVGFSGKERTGQYGLEAYYEEALSGKKSEGGKFSPSAVYSFLVGLFDFLNKEEQEGDQTALGATGSDIILTIDKNIQEFVEIKLEELINKWNAPKGLIIVQEPETGAILAMASYPGFDPNNYSVHNLGDFINPAVQEVFEPGSSFKPITMAAAVDAGAVTPETTYNDTGEVKIGGYTIRNFNDKSNGIQTMRQVLQHSLNTGAIFAQQKLGSDPFLNYVVGFGMGQRTGIDLGGEVIGNISNLFTGRPINFATASFGQGVAVTPIQLINAYSALANGGKLMRPYIVKEITYPDGSSKKTNPQIIGLPVSEKTSLKMKSMLADVVEKGFDKARIKGYDVAGKTGTAQIPDQKGGYLGDDQFIHNFVGFAPAYSPKFTILIKLDKPKGIRFAADSLSPAFGDVARFLLRYFNVPPTG